MNGLIKRGRFVAGHRSASAGPQPEASVDLVSVLEAQLQAITAEHDREREHWQERERQAHALGMKDGRDAERKEKDKRYSALTQALEINAKLALEKLDSSLVATSEELALTLARIGLERVLGDASLYSDLVAKAITQQLDSLGGQSVVAVTVSAMDFPNGVATDIERALMDSRIQFRRDSRMTTGGCLIQLELGEIDISIPEQRRRLLDKLWESAHG